MLDSLLIFRMTIFNALAAAGVVWAYQMGFVTDMFGNDDSYMTYVATVLFLFGTISCFARARKISAHLDRLKRGFTPEFNGAKFMEKSAHLDDIGDLIVVIGLTGTAIGVVLMLRAFDAGSLTDPAKVVETATALGEGLGTAFRSTIVSSILWCIHLVNLRMLKTATILAVEDSQ